MLIHGLSRFASLGVILYPVTTGGCAVAVLLLLIAWPFINKRLDRIKEVSAAASYFRRDDSSDFV